MTREEAITRLHWPKRELIKGTDMNKPIDMAIYALMREQQFMYNASQGTTTILNIGNRYFEVRERMI